ncbi:MAG: MBL fold metallo-hydrolase [Ruminococcus sp.]|nr:MBL fold metallo-hydrolase [Ruminococcus sp.]
MAEKKATSKASPEKPQKKGLIWIIGFIIAVIAGVLFGIPDKSDEVSTGVADSNLQVHYIDVGQGDCILLENGDDTLLIDCGEIGEDDTVKAYLEKQGINQLDYVVGTHPHSDHMGCMDKIVVSYDIGEIILPHIDDSDIPTTKYFERFMTSVESKGYSITEAETGRKFSVGDAECEIIAPCSDDYSNANNYSVGIIVHHGENSFIFTGDAEKLAEKELIESGRLEDIDVYKVGHHGSDTSSSEEFLEIIKPDIAVISCGTGNKYGHPCDITLEKLVKYTDRIYRTDISGTVVITSDGKSLAVTEEKSQ